MKWESKNKKDRKTDRVNEIKTTRKKAQKYTSNERKRNDKIIAHATKAWSNYDNWEEKSRMTVPQKRVDKCNRNFLKKMHQ